MLSPFLRFIKMTVTRFVGRFRCLYVVSGKFASHALFRIMDKLLDREVHQLLKTPLISSYYTNNPPIRSQYNQPRREDCDNAIAPISPFMPTPDAVATECSELFHI